MAALTLRLTPAMQSLLLPLLFAGAKPGCWSPALACFAALALHIKQTLVAAAISKASVCRQQ